MEKTGILRTCSITNGFVKAVQTPAFRSTQRRHLATAGAYKLPPPFNEQNVSSPTCLNPMNATNRLEAPLCEFIARASETRGRPFSAAIKAANIRSKNAEWRSSRESAE